MNTMGEDSDNDNSQNADKEEKDKLLNYPKTNEQPYKNQRPKQEEAGVGDLLPRPESRRIAT